MNKKVRNTVYRILGMNKDANQKRLQSPPGKCKGSSKRGCREIQSLSREQLDTGTSKNHFLLKDDYRCQTARIRSRDSPLLSWKCRQMQQRGEEPA